MYMILPTVIRKKLISNFGNDYYNCDIKKKSPEVSNMQTSVYRISSSGERYIGVVVS